MQAQVTDLWREAMRLSRLEKMELLEKLIHQIKIEEEQGEQKNLNWDHLYGAGKGVWDLDAQEYVNQLREDRF